MKNIASLVMKEIPQVKINVEKIINNFFGETITVAGLITGGDLYEQLKNKALGDCLLIPSVMLRSDGTVFLDDETVDGLSEKLELQVKVCPVDGSKFVNGILELLK